tara:strand:- start:8314 stop:9033 length:720 start_codon:yes stop_codon:yes gene_type:complete
MFSSDESSDNRSDDDSVESRDERLNYGQKALEDFLNTEISNRPVYAARSRSTYTQYNVPTIDIFGSEVVEPKMPSNARQALYEYVIVKKNPTYQIKNINTTILNQLYGIGTSRVKKEVPHTLIIEKRGKNVRDVAADGLTDAFSSLTTPTEAAKIEDLEAQTSGLLGTTSTVLDEEKKEEETESTPAAPFSFTFDKPTFGPGSGGAKKKGKKALTRRKPKKAKKSKGKKSKSKGLYKKK